MGVKCQILINKIKGEYKPGLAVTGRVKFCADERTEYKNIILSFVGRGKCSWTERSRKDRRTYSGTEDYFNTIVNICNKKPSDKAITLEGDYEYPFEFLLPENIPPSYKDVYSSISYYIELKFQKTSFFSFDRVFTAEIPVYSNTKYTPEARPIIFGLQKKLFAPFASQTPVVNLKAVIEKTCVSPGENVNLTYLVTNYTDMKITSVRTELYCCTTYTANVGRTKILTDKVNSCEVETPGVSEREVTKFSCFLPTLPELYSLTDSKIISKEYFVRVTVRLPIPHINAMKDFKIQIREQIDSIDLDAEVEDTDGPPPSYWEVMKEIDAE